MIAYRGWQAPSESHFTLSWLGQKRERLDTIRRMKFRHALAVALILSASIATPVVARGVNVPKVSASKSLDGPFENLVSTTFQKGQTKNLYFKVFSPSTQVVEFFSITGGASNAYDIRWFAGKTPSSSPEITTAVVTDGYRYFARRNQNQVFTAKVKRTGSRSMLCLEARAQGDANSSSFGRAFFSLNARNACSGDV